MSKTISQLSKEIGVTRQAVWHKIKNKKFASQLKGHTKTIGNTIYIDTTGEEIIIKAFELLLTERKNNPKNTNDKQETSKDLSTENVKENTKTDININQQVLDILNQQISTLNQENKELRDELNEQRKYICEIADKLAELANNAQKLHASNILIPKLSSPSETKPLTQKHNIFNFLFKRKPKIKES